MKIKTVHEWIKSIEQLSDFVLSLNLRNEIPDKPLNADAYNFANNKIHQELIAQALQNCSEFSDFNHDPVKTLTKQLFSSEVVGAFGELFVYNWLVKARLSPKMQVYQTAQDVLCGNGSELDGVFRIGSKEIYFDVKSFGLTEKVVKELKNKLEKILTGKIVSIEGTWDVSVEDLSKMMSKAELGSIVSALQSGQVITKPPLTIRAQEKKEQSVYLSSRTSNPYELAQQNANYPLKYAHKFTRKSPFICNGHYLI